MTTPAEPVVQVAGLLIPESLMVRINAACKGMYPDITAGLTDAPATRAVLKYFISTVLANWEYQQAAAGAEDEVKRVRDDYQQKADAARQQAVTDAAQITDAPDTPPPAVP